MAANHSRKPEISRTTVYTYAEAAKLIGKSEMTIRRAVVNGNLRGGNNCVTGRALLHCREIAMRERVYPRWIELHKMTPAKADHEIAAMKAVLATLQSLAPKELQTRGLFE